MATYTAPTTRSTGALITAAIFNTDLVENIKYFKDAPSITSLTTSGAVTFGSQVTSTTALATPSALVATTSTRFASTVSGAATMGFGTTHDVTLMNRAGTVVLGVTANTTGVTMAGALSVADLLTLTGNSATHTTGLSFNGSNGGAIAATHASGAIRFYSGGTSLRGGFNSNGVFSVGAALGTATGSTNAFSFDPYSEVSAQFSHTTTANQGWVNFYNSNGAIGSITGSGTATAFNTSSDQRLKSDHGVATDLSVLQRTIIHDFSWLVDGKVDRGVFAQEAYAVLPAAISPGNDTVTADGRLAKPWMADYSKYVPDLIVGWQQHDATMQQHDARLAALEAKLLKETA